MRTWFLHQTLNAPPCPCSGGGVFIQTPSGKAETSEEEDIVQDGGPEDDEEWGEEEEDDDEDEEWREEDEEDEGEEKAEVCAQVFPPDRQTLAITVVQSATCICRPSSRQTLRCKDPINILFAIRQKQNCVVVNDCGPNYTP